MLDRARGDGRRGVRLLDVAAHAVAVEGTGGRPLQPLADRRREVLGLHPARDHPEPPVRSDDLVAAAVRRGDDRQAGRQRLGNDDAERLARARVHEQLRASHRRRDGLARHRPFDRDGLALGQAELVDQAPPLGLFLGRPGRSDQPQAQSGPLGAGA